MREGKQNEEDGDEKKENMYVGKEGESKKEKNDEGSRKGEGLLSKG